MDQDQATEHFPYRHGLLPTVGDAGVGRALHVEPDKINVLRHYDTSGGGGELEVRHIGRADQARFRRGNHLNVPPPKTSGNVA